MEKEKLLSELKTKIGTTALSDRTLDEYASSILPTVTSDEQVNEAFWSMHTSILKSFEGNLNHVVANKVNEFKTEWEKTHPQTEPPKDAPEVDAPTDDRYEALMKEVENLKKANEESIRKTALESLKSQILSKSSDLHVSNKNLWNDCVAAVQVTEGKTVDEILGLVKNDYESRLKSYFGDSAVPYGGLQSPQRVSKDVANAKRDAFKKKMQSQGKLPKND